MADSGPCSTVNSSIRSRECWRQLTVHAEENASILSGIWVPTASLVSALAVPARFGELWGFEVGSFSAMFFR